MSNSRSSRSHRAGTSQPSNNGLNPAQNSLIPANTAPGSTSSGPVTSSVHVALDLISARIERQRDQVDKLDGKAVAILTWAGVLLGVAVTVFTAGLTTHHSTRATLARLVALIPMMYFTVRSAWSFRGAYRIRDFHLTPEPTPLLKLLDDPEEDTMRGVAEQMAKDYDRNVHLIDDKADCIQMMIFFLWAEALALIPTLAFLAMS